MKRLLFILFGVFLFGSVNSTIYAQCPPPEITVTVDPDNGTILVEWTSGGHGTTGYTLFLTGTTPFSVPPTTTSWEFGPLAPGEYEVCVAANCLFTSSSPVCETVTLLDMPCDNDNIDSTPCERINNIVLDGCTLTFSALYTDEFNKVNCQEIHLIIDDGTTTETIVYPDSDPTTGSNWIDLEHVFDEDGTYTISFELIHCIPDPPQDPIPPTLICDLPEILCITDCEDECTDVHDLPSHTEKNIFCFEESPTGEQTYFLSVWLGNWDQGIANLEFCSDEVEVTGGIFTDAVITIGGGTITIDGYLTVTPPVGDICFTFPICIDGEECTGTFCLENPLPPCTDCDFDVDITNITLTENLAPTCPSPGCEGSTAYDVDIDFTVSGLDPSTNHMVSIIPSFGLAGVPNSSTTTCDALPFDIKMSNGVGVITVNDYAIFEWFDCWYDYFCFNVFVRNLVTGEVCEEQFCFTFEELGLNFGGDADEYAKDNSTNLNQNIAIYPNPAREFITISNPQDLDISIELYNTNGQQIMTENVNTTATKRISLNNLSQGIYFLKIKEVNTKQYLKTEKLVIVK